MRPEVTNWGNSGPNTFVVLQEGTDIAEFTDKIAGFIKTKSEDTHCTLFLIKYSDNYLYGNFENGVQSGGRIEYVTLFSIIAIFILIIACLGLFGLAAFTAERRRKEIGIRKVLGSSEFSIVYLLSGDFTKLVFVSILIALPFSYLMTKQWLAGFAYKIPLEWWEDRLTLKIGTDHPEDETKNEITFNVNEDYIYKNVLAILDLIVSNEWNLKAADILLALNKNDLAESLAKAAFYYYHDLVKADLKAHKKPDDLDVYLLRESSAMLAQSGKIEYVKKLNGLGI